MGTVGHVKDGGRTGSTTHKTPKPLPQTLEEYICSCSPSLCSDPESYSGLVKYIHFTRRRIQQRFGPFKPPSRTCLYRP